MFVLQDMVVEVAILAMVLVVVLLSAAVLGAICRERLERRREHEARRRLRRKVWREYAAACAPVAEQTAGARIRPRPQAGTAPRAARDQSAGLSARPA
jgi:hypothetical protein